MRSSCRATTVRERIGDSLRYHHGPPMTNAVAVGRVVVGVSGVLHRSRQKPHPGGELQAIPNDTPLRTWMRNVWTMSWRSGLPMTGASSFGGLRS